MRSLSEIEANAGREHCDEKGQMEWVRLHLARGYYVPGVTQSSSNLMRATDAILSFVVATFKQ